MSGDLDHQATALREAELRAQAKRAMRPSTRHRPPEPSLLARLLSLLGIK